MGKSLVSGEIQFAKRPRLPSDARVYVRLLDISFADAPSRLIAEQVLTGIWQRANAGESIPFEISASLPNEHGSYSVAVLVDVDGDGKTTRGDFVSTQSYPVLTFGYPNHVTIVVDEVT
jgi:uncharacterized lipoprotein YbaY